MTVVMRDSIYDLDKCISERTKAENERDQLRTENEALKVKLGVAVDALSEAEKDLTSLTICGDLRWSNFAMESWRRTMKALKAIRGDA